MSSTSNEMDNQLKSADPGHNVSLSEQHESEHTILLENPVMINEDQIEHNVQYLRIQTSAGAEYLIHSDMAAAGEQLQNAFYAQESDGSGIYNVRTEDGHLRIDDVSEHDAQDDHLEKSEGIDMDLDDIANVNHDASHIGSQFTAQMDKTASLPSHLSSMLTVINAESKDNSKQEALPATADEHAIKIFNTVQATLDTEFVDYISSLNSPSYLHDVSTQHQVELNISGVRNNESTYLCKGTVTALNHFEKYLYMVLYGEETYEQKFTKSVQANLESKPQLIDKCVGCDIPKPVFSRSGRQVKLKAELMESADEDYLLPAILDAPSNVSEPGKRKRGRPPKKKPKMIHVDKEAKVTVIKEKSHISGGVKEEQNVAEGDESAVEEVTKKDGKLCADLPVKVKSERIPERVCDILEPQHEPYIQKATVERFDRHTAVDDSLKAMKKKYEDRMPFKFSCDMCSFRTKRRSHLVKHKAIHVKKNLPLLKCDKCSFSTLRNGHLSRHMLTHRTDNVKCSKCDYVTSSVKHMRFHMKKRHAGQEVELPDQPVQVQICQICKYETDRPHAMKRHMKIHEIDDGKLVYMFECKLCTYKTEKKIHFTRHMVVVHSEKRPFLCDTCGRGFKRADALKQHRVVHMSKDARSYSYFCDECHKGFRSPAHLREHASIHSAARPFLCHVCGASFKTKNVQRKHIMTLHSNPRSYQCETCQRCFNTAYALRRHAKSHEKEQHLLEPGELTGVTLVREDIPQQAGGAVLSAASVAVEGGEELLPAAAADSAVFLQHGAFQIVSAGGGDAGQFDFSQGNIQVVMIHTNEDGSTSQQVLSAESMAGVEELVSQATVVAGGDHSAGAGAMLPFITAYDPDGGGDASAPQQ